MSKYSEPKYHSKNQRYYKYKESGQHKDILDSEDKKALEKGNTGYHDHFFKRSGTWYVQTKIDNRHLFDDLIPSGRGVEVAEQGEYLDDLFEELKSLRDC